MRSRSVTIWVMVGVLCVSSSQVMGWIQYNDGGTYDITTTINEDVWVDWEAPGMGTTVNVLSGGSILSLYELRGYNDSILTVSGGSVGYRIHAYDNTYVDVSDGSINSLYTDDNTHVDVSGGSVGYIHAYDNTFINISGGSVGDIRANGDTFINISRG